MIASRDAARNLLLGILALQNNFVSRDVLLAAFAAWTADKSRSFGDLLVFRGSLLPSHLELLNDLVNIHLERHEGSLEKSLAAVTSPQEVREELAKLNDSELKASLQLVSARPKGQPDPYLTEPFTPAGHNGGLRFQFLRPHAEGGLGKVSVARDEELHREVALKEIKARFADDPDSRARFLREAEITGGLEHPGIVPVYGLGRYADGRPFYAMRFIQGTTLKAAIEKFHQTRLGGDTTRVDGRHSPTPAAKVQGSPSERNLEIRKLLQTLIHVCEAMEYAHSRGVLHRDIKPDNIMLGKYGETLVVDWGLARAGGEVEDEGSHKEHPLLTSPSNAATQFGSAVGTPAFMSPEQAAGRLDLLCRGSDIYSLGATLYAILTGRVPIEGKDLGVVLQRVQAGDFPRPRSIRRKLPPALEAICLKAMARRPDDRYASARDLASDIEKWLADERISAYRESALQRASRWARKNKGLVRAAACGMLLVTAIAVLSAVRINVERLHVVEQREQAEQQRKRAEQLVIEKDNLARSERELRSAAEQLSTDNQRIAQEKTKLADEQRQEANKSRRLAEFLVGTFQAADPVGMGGATFFIPKANSEQLTARQILDRGAERVKNDKHLDPLAKAAIMNEIGDVYRQLGLFPQALPLLTEALEIRRGLLPKDHADVAASCFQLGWYHHERGDFLRAEPLYREALEIRKKITGEEGDRLMAASLQNLAWMLANAREPAQAETLFRQALEVRQRLFGKLHREVCFTKFGIAFALIEQGRLAEATPLVLAAQGELLQLEGNQHITTAATSFALGVISRETPLVGLTISETQLRQAYKSVVAAFGPDNIYAGLVQFELGSTLEEQGRIEDAEECYQDALRISRDQVQMQHPRISLLVSRYSSLLAKRGQAEEGKQLWNEFITAQRGRFGDDNPFLADALVPYGMFLKDRREYAAGLKVVEDAIRIYELHPQKSYLFHVDALQQAGLCHLDGDLDAAKAEACFRQAREILKRDRLGQANDDLALRINLATSLLEQRKFTQAEELLLAANKDAAQASGASGRDCLEYSLQTLARLYLAQRQPAKAAEYISARKGYKSGSSRDLYNIAAQFAQCAKLVGAEGRELTAEEQTEKLRYAELALGKLKGSISAGLKNHIRLLRDEDFSALRDHAEFQQLVAPPDAKQP